MTVLARIKAGSRAALHLSSQIFWDHFSPVAKRLISVALYPLDKYTWTLAAIQAVSFAVAFYWFQWPPSSGIAVAGLGLVAIVMAVRDEEKWGRTERIAWLVLASILMSVEIRAIQQEHNRHEVEMAAARGREEVARRNADTAFEALLKKGNAIFQRQDELSKEDRDRATGGDSYIVVVPNTAIAVEGPNTFVSGAYIGKNGKGNGIPDAHIYVRQLPILNVGKASWYSDFLAGKNPDFAPVFVGTINPNWFQLLPKRITPSFTETTEYIVNVFARNKPTVETLRMRRNVQTGMWEYSVKVMREIEPSPGPNKPGKLVTLEVTKPEWQTQVFVESK